MANTLENYNAILGAYYRKHSAEFNKAIMMGFVSSPTFKIETAVKNQYVATMTHLSQAWQPGQRGFTRTNGLQFIPETIQVEPIKSDYAFTLEDLRDFEKSALNPLILGSDSGNTKVAPAFSRVLIEQLIATKNKEMEFSISEKGVKVAPTHPNPGKPGESVNGIEKVLDDAVAAGKLLPIGLGNYGAEETFDYVEEFVESLPIEIKEFGVAIEVSPWVYSNYWKGRRTKFGGNNDYDPSKPLSVLEYENVVLKKIPGKGSSKRLVATVPNNKVMVVDDIGELDRMTFDYHISAREIRIVSDAKIGFGFESFGVLGSSKPSEYLVHINDVK